MSALSVGLSEDRRRKYQRDSSWSHLSGCLWGQEAECPPGWVKSFYFGLNGVQDIWFFTVSFWRKTNKCPTEGRVTLTDLDIVSEDGTDRSLSFRMVSIFVYEVKQESVRHDSKSKNNWTTSHFVSDWSFSLDDVFVLMLDRPECLKLIQDQIGNIWINL